MHPRLIVEHAGEATAWTLTSQEATSNLADLLARRELPLNTRCGGRGLCRGCEIQLTAGTLLDATGRPHAAPATLKACQHRLQGGEAAINVPARSHLRHEPAVVSEFQLGVPWCLDPLTSARYGVAVDVGTTTVALLLCDLFSGQVLAEASAFNAQVRFGEDVVTRIQLCSSDSGAVTRLQQAVAAETVQPLLERAAREARIDLAEVGAMTVAGNTTMQHLLAGVDPTPMGTHPFRPVFLEHRIFAPGQLGLQFGSAEATVHLLPSPAAYVGADLAAGLVATGMVYDREPSVLIDVGTNGEILASAGGRLIGCATAAGPAFEGAGLSSGTRAVHGAIERVVIANDPFSIRTQIIGHAAHPTGVCGSAYIDLLWEGRRAGLLLPSGRFDPAFVAAHAEHFELSQYGQRLKLHPHGHGSVFFSEPDVASLLQAKAAIAAGVQTLLGILGLRAADVKTVYLAGGFGRHLSPAHAIGCGLLPGFSPEQIKVVGNTSLGGAFLALQDRSLLEVMSAAAHRHETIELNLQPGFEDAYIDHLSLP